MVVGILDLLVRKDFRRANLVEGQRKLPLFSNLRKLRLCYSSVQTPKNQVFPRFREVISQKIFNILFSKNIQRTSKSDRFRQFIKSAIPCTPTWILIVFI